jgi:hypothetical protein
MRAAISALLLLFVSLASAMAEIAIPSFDPSAACRSLGARTGARSEDDLSACERREIASRDRVASAWPTVTEEIRALCARRAEARQSFETLRNCLDIEGNRRRP